MNERCAILHACSKYVYSGQLLKDFLKFNVQCVVTCYLLKDVLYILLDIKKPITMVSRLLHHNSTKGTRYSYIESLVH